MNVSKKHLVRYYFFCFAIIAVCVLIMVCSVFFLEPLLIFLLGVVLSILFGLSVLTFARKNFFGILARERHAQKFRDTIYHPPFRPTAEYRLNAEWYAGNYGKLVTLASAGYRASKSLQEKCICLAFLARAYFEAHDVEKLREITDLFFRLRETNPDQKKLFARFKAFEFYRAFVDEDYAQCMELTKEQMKRFKTKRMEDKLNLLTYRSNEAVCSYWLGDYQKAKEQFEYFIQNTPNLNNFHELAAKYLSAIENNDPTMPDTIIEEESTEADDLRLLSLQKKTRIATVIVFVFIVAGLFVTYEIGYFIGHLNELDGNSTIMNEFDDELNSAISKNYANGKLVVSFRATNENRHSEPFCLVDHDGQWDLATMVSYDGGASHDLIIFVKDVQLSSDYSVISDISKYQTDLCVSDTPLSESDYMDVLEFSYNNVNYWIGIKNMVRFS